MEKDTFKEETDKILELEKKLKEAKKINEELNYSEEEIEKLDNKISSITEELNTLLEKRKKMAQHLEDVKSLESSLEYAKYKLKNKRNDYSKEEFCERLKQVFQSYLNDKTDDLEKQIHNKLVLLIIEYNIIGRLYEKKLEKEKNLFATPNDVEYKEIIVPVSESKKNKLSFFKKKEESRTIRKRISKKEQKGEELYSDLAFVRVNEIREIVNCIWGVNDAIRLFYNSDTYKNIIDKLINNPQEIGIHYGGGIIINDGELLDDEMAQKLYEELLIPYYIQMGFPVKEENDKKIPYAFVLGEFNGDKNYIQRKTLKEVVARKFYKEKGIDESLWGKFAHPHFYINWGEDRGSWIDETMFLSPSEIILLNKYNFIEKYEKRLIEIIEKRNEILNNKIEKYTNNQEKTHTK